MESNMVTIKDVAEQAGVSVATVSNALTENRGVNAETKKKVLKIAKQLNYTPNLIATSLVTKKTNIIGIFLYNFVESNYLPYSEFLKGATQKCQQNGQRVLIYTDITEEQFKASFVMGHDPMDAGIIFFPQEDEFRAEDLKNARLPFVFVGKSKGFNFVDCENVKLTYKITKKLIYAGHKHICFVNSDKKWALSQDRHEGFAKALLESNIDLSECLEYNLYKNEKPNDKILQAINSGYRAFIVESPIAVMFLYKYCKDNELQIGKDISIVFLGHDSRFDTIYPSLTCAKVSYVRLGEMAIDVITQGDLNKKNRAYYLDAEIIEGESIANI